MFRLCLYPLIYAAIQQNSGSDRHPNKLLRKREKILRNNQKTAVVLLQIIYVLSVLLFIAGIWIINNEYKFNLNYDIFGPIVTFAGALLGALITGRTAISINKKEQERIQERENTESEKVKKILQQYFAIMLAEYIDMMDCLKKQITLKNPWWAKEIEQVGEDKYDFKYKPSPDKKRKFSTNLSIEKYYKNFSRTFYIRSGKIFGS